MPLRDRQIEVFQVVMEASSLNDAADRLCISQPSVSRILARFEQVAGFQAFEHRGRRLVPTEAAKIFYREARRIQKGIDHLNKVAEEISNFRLGHLSIGVLPSLSNAWIVSALADFIDQYPQIKLSIISRPSRDIVEAVDMQRIDMGISLFESESETVQCSKLLALENVCILPKAHRLCGNATIDLPDLEGERFIGLINSEYSTVWSQNNILVSKQPVASFLKASSAAAVCHLVAANRGVSIVSDVVAAEHRHLDIEVRSLNPKRSQPVYLLQSRHRAYSPLGDILADMLRAAR